MMHSIPAFSPYAQSPVINNYYGNMSSGWGGAMPTPQAPINPQLTMAIQNAMQGMSHLLGVLSHFGLTAQCGLGGTPFGMPNMCSPMPQCPWQSIPCGSVFNGAGNTPQPWHQVSKPVDNQGRAVGGRYTEDGAFYIKPEAIGKGMNVVDPNTKIQKLVKGEWVDV